jgi:hypothetical protein
MRNIILSCIIITGISCQYRDNNPIKEQQIPQSNDAFNKSADKKEDSLLDIGVSATDTNKNIQNQISSLKNTDYTAKYIADSVERSLKRSSTQSITPSETRKQNSPPRSTTNVSASQHKKISKPQIADNSLDSFADQFQGFNNSVVFAEKTTKQAISNNKQSVQTNQISDLTIQAIIPEKCLVSNGGTIRLKTTSNIEIDNQNFTVGSIVTGRASFNDDRMYIVIRSINLNGSIKKIDLTVYDNDGAEGISIPSINIKKKTSNGLGGVINTAGSLLSRGSSVGSQLSSNLVRSVTSGNLETITIPGNKKVIIRSNN